MITKSNIIGTLILLSTLMVWLSGVGDTVKELNDWHGLGTPEIVGVLLSQFGKLFSAAIGGMLIDIRGNQDKTDKVSATELQALNKKEDK